jgi:hypothetical protein
MISVFVQAARHTAVNGSMFLNSVVNESFLRRFDPYSDNGLPDILPPSNSLPCCSLRLPYLQQIYSIPRSCRIPTRLQPQERLPNYFFWEYVNQQCLLCVQSPSGAKTAPVTYHHTISRSPHCIYYSTPRYLRRPKYFTGTFISTDHVRNAEVLLRVKKQRNILHEISKRKTNWIGHILRRHCLLQKVIERKIKEGIEVTGRRGRRHRKLPGDINL